MANIIIQALEQERAELLKKVEHLDEMIARFNKNGASVSSSFNGDSGAEKAVGLDYPAKKSLQEKILFVFRTENRFLHNREIADFIAAQEPIPDYNKLIGSISSILSRLKREEALANYQVDNRNTATFWGSPKWLVNGQPKEEHKHSMKYVKDKTLRLEI